MTGTLILVGSAFLASAVEMVEALTIVLAVGLTHNWRTALTGVLAALLALAVVVGALGPSLVHYVPIDDLRVVVGLLLVIFGLQWMRKAILRVPENAIKFAVGVALVAFGTFWGGEGIGVDWTLGDGTIPLLAALYAGTAWLIVFSLQRRGTTHLSIQEVG